MADKVLDSSIMRVYARVMNTRCYCTILRRMTRRTASLYDEALAPIGINIAQYSLLRSISRMQPVSLTELGRHAELDRSTMGRNVRVLERMGLAATSRSEEDQREQMVSLTEQGRARLDEAEPLWLECQHRIEERLGVDKLQALHDLLETL